LLRYALEEQANVKMKVRKEQKHRLVALDAAFMKSSGGHKIFSTRIMDSHIAYGL
jgi:hypothetical protein